MKFGTQTKKDMPSPKSQKRGIPPFFQDGRRRHLWNSSACYKIGISHWILMKFGTQTNEITPSSKITKSWCAAIFQDGRRRHVGNSSA